MRKLSARAARSPDLNLRLLLKCANCDAQGQRDNTTPRSIYLSALSLSADTNTIYAAWYTARRTKNWGEWVIGRAFDAARGENAKILSLSSAAGVYFRSRRAARLVFVCHLYTTRPSRDSNQPALDFYAHTHIRVRGNVSEVPGSTAFINSFRSTQVITEISNARKIKQLLMRIYFKVPWQRR